MTTSVLERFLRYVRIDTRSDEKSRTVPTTPGQLVLLRLLVEELHDLGIADATMDEHGYVTATVPASASVTGVPVVGFLAHVDTSPEMPGHDVRPIVHERYDGRDLVLLGLAVLGRGRAGMAGARDDQRARGGRSQERTAIGAHP